jgi:toxin ParE1/3/4
VANCRLSDAAEADLIKVAQFGDERFGVAQSDRYRNALEMRFRLLAESPFLYPAISHIRPGYRRSVCGVHSIYYQIASKGVLIVRVLGRQDPTKALE